MNTLKTLLLDWKEKTRQFGFFQTGQGECSTVEQEHFGKYFYEF